MCQKKDHFSQSAENGGFVKWHKFLRFSSVWPPPARIFEPSKVHFRVKFAIFSRNCAFLRFPSLPWHLKPRLQNYILRENASFDQKVNFGVWSIFGGRCCGLEKCKKTPFREKIAIFTKKLTLRVEESSLEGSGRSKNVETGVICKFGTFWKNYTLREKCSFDRKVDFEGWSVLAEGGWNLEEANQCLSVWNTSHFGLNWFWRKKWGFLWQSHM